MPGKVFVSYSHKDAKWLETVRSFIAPKGAGGLDLDLWTDKRIEAGSDWFKTIEDAVNGSQYSILLVSQYFLDSDFIWKHEVPKLLELRQKGHVIFWIPIADSTVRETELGPLQAVWDVSQPLAKLSKPKRDSALVEIARRIRSGMAGRT